MKLGCNTILFGAFDLDTALKHIAWAGFDGVELMGAHVRACLDENVAAGTVEDLASSYGLEIYSFEMAAEEGILDYARELGLGLIASGPPGRHEDLDAFISAARAIASEAEQAGVKIAVKPHVGHPVFDTPSMERFMAEVDSPWFGINFDPSHIFRADRKPEESVLAVGQHIIHSHFRDCPDPSERGPGDPWLQVPGRGKIDITATLRALKQVGYDGYLSLQIVGPHNREEDCPLSRVMGIAAEGKGYLSRCLAELG